MLCHAVWWLIHSEPGVGNADEEKETTRVCTQPVADLQLTVHLFLYCLCSGVASFWLNVLHCRDTNCRQLEFRMFFYFGQPPSARWRFCCSLFIVQRELLERSMSKVLWGMDSAWWKQLQIRRTTWIIVLDSRWRFLKRCVCVRVCCVCARACCWCWCSPDNSDTWILSSLSDTIQ